ncbi:MAG: hypothetical protein ABF968_04995 [Acetobacter sp.]|uniref:hypothetical protein n=1 Tax=Acetobacter sp. TaxID=440 RepID=UPI0039ED6C59
MRAMKKEYYRLMDEINESDYFSNHTRKIANDFIKKAYDIGFSDAEEIVSASYKKANQAVADLQGYVQKIEVAE